ncbi:unnamed protein product [Cuscuta europaea]|uniref:Retrovirus-related Pol polyprotein from transposon TNT 1-94-like beta-barrel domain-containing protein n=1 Tax=Cuscuta europaea TaxID=41803 RepID=A0A9P1ENX7_CUSEU|nr:unnamed protein product [Cuscuta europaea]
MTSSEGILLNKSTYFGATSVSVANAAQLPICHIGDVTLPSSGRALTLRYVYHVPQIKYNLISIKNCVMITIVLLFFYKNSFFVKDKTSGAVLLQATSSGPLYPISLCHPPLALASVTAPGPMWHRRLGHCSDTILQRARNNRSKYLELFSYLLRTLAKPQRINLIPFISFSLSTHLLCIIYQCPNPRLPRAVSNSPDLLGLSTLPAHASSSAAANYMCVIDNSIAAGCSQFLEAFEFASVIQS